MWQTVGMTHFGQITVERAKAAVAKSREAARKLADSRKKTATMMYLETVRKNYGKAGEYSKEFFDQAQRIVSRTDGSAVI